MDKTIALVLGAGASAWLEFPLGGTLRNRILNLVDHERFSFAVNTGLYSFGEHELKIFINEFKKSQMNSIDSFLARRREYTDIGKAAIAAILLEAESQNDLFSHESKDNWYRYLLNRLSSETWNELDFSQLKIVTFNYDRSLEFYLKGSLQHAYGKTIEEVEEKLSQLEIIHVYGSLGSAFKTDQDFLTYGAKLESEIVLKSSKNLRVIPEGRDSDPVLNQARELLTQADAIAFLGFGFDSINIKRLDAEKTCCRQISLNGNRFERYIAATTMGLKASEILKIANLLQALLDHGPTLPPTGFESSTCLNLLRETLILDKILD